MFPDKNRLKDAGVKSDNPIAVRIGSTYKAFPKYDMIKSCLINCKGAKL